MRCQRAFRIGCRVVTFGAVAGVIAWLALALLDARKAVAAVEPSAVDIGFVQTMATHHQQAVWMSHLLLDGRPTALTRMAQSIAYGQMEELGRMRGWMRLWNLSASPTRISMNWMLLGGSPPPPELAKYLLDCRREPTGMTGLATDDQVNRLNTLSGRERDLTYLRLMLAHHEGALPMSRFAASNAALPAVRELASRIVREQTDEVMRIQAFLR